MNAVHPTFAPFLRAALAHAERQHRIAAFKRAKDAVIHSYQPPPCPIGWLEYIHKFGPLQIVCHLEYEILEKGINGSPDLAAETRLISAYINGAEVSECLDKDLVKLIEITAASQLED